MTIFLKMKEIFTSIIDTITQDAVKTHIQEVTVLLGAWFTLLILYHGFMILSGKGEQSVKDLLWKLIGAMMVIAFAYNSPTLVGDVSNAINGIHTWASTNDIGIWDTLDKIFKKAVTVANIAEEQDGNLELNGLVAKIIILLGFSLFAMVTCWMIVTTSFFLHVAIMLAPLMIFSRLFPWTKRLFEGWLKLIIANALTLMLVSVFFNTLVDKYANFIKDAISKAKETEVIALSFEILYVSLLAMLFIMISRIIAEKLTQMTLEGIASVSTNHTSTSRQINRPHYQTNYVVKKK